MQKAQGLRLLLPLHSGLDACFGLPCTLRQVPSALAGWGGTGTAGGRLHWSLAGAWTGSGRATSCSSLAKAVLQSINPVIPLYSVATVMLDCVGNWRCSSLRALDWSAEAACRAEAGFLVKKSIIAHFYVIITLLLPVMTVIMALLLHIFTLLLHHYCIL